MESFARSARPTIEGVFEYPSGYPNFQTLRDWKDIYITTLMAIVHAMRRHKCGGTLVITDDSSFPSISEPNHQLSKWFERNKDGMPTVPIRMLKYYQTLRECEFQALTKEFAKSDTQTALFFVRGYFERLYRDFSELLRAARFIGQLTAADGAVVLKPDLSACTIGAKLKTGLKPTCRQLPNKAINASEKYYDSLPKYSKPRGSRFNSALCCIENDPQSLVLMASADGMVSGFVGAQGGVLIAEPISLAPVTFF